MEHIDLTLLAPHSTPPLRPALFQASERLCSSPCLPSAGITTALWATCHAEPFTAFSEFRRTLERVM